MDPLAKPAVAQEAGGKHSGGEASQGDRRRRISPTSRKATKNMGLDEVKSSDPTKNPLDKGPDIDNLLDGLDK